MLPIADLCAGCGGDLAGATGLSCLLVLCGQSGRHFLVRRRRGLGTQGFQGESWCNNFTYVYFHMPQNNYTVFISLHKPTDEKIEIY